MIVIAIKSVNVKLIAHCFMPINTSIVHEFYYSKPEMEAESVVDVVMNGCEWLCA